MATHREYQRRGLAGVGRSRSKPVGQVFGEIMEGGALSANVAADLALIEDQGKGVGQKPDHGEHHKSRSLIRQRLRLNSWMNSGEIEPRSKLEAGTK